MNVSREVEQQIARLAAEGRVVERVDPCADDAAEKDFQADVIRLSRSLGWIEYHTYDSRRSNPGFPDLILWRERLMFMELKSAKGKLTTDQMRTLDELRLAGQEVYCFRPADWPQVEAVLRRRTA